jgi:hypothetical protein
MASRYVRVTLRPLGRRRYPHYAKLVSFVMKRRHYMDAAKTLMCWMGYGCHQYNVVSVEDATSVT